MIGDKTIRRDIRAKQLSMPYISFDWLDQFGSPVFMRGATATFSIFKVNKATARSSASIDDPVLVLKSGNVALVGLAPLHIFIKDVAGKIDVHIPYRAMNFPAGEYNYTLDMTWIDHTFTIYSGKFYMEQANPNDNVFDDTTLIGHDTFTDVGGTLLSAHTPEVGTWTDASDSFKVNGTGVTCRPTGVSGAALMEGFTTNGTIECDFTTVPYGFGGGAVMVAHYVDSSNYIQIGYAYGFWSCTSITGGSIEGISVVVSGAAPGDNVKLVLEGAYCDLIVNGVFCGTVTVNAGKQAEASHGFYNVGSQIAMRADNFKIYEPA